MKRAAWLAGGGLVAAVLSVLGFTRLGDEKSPLTIRRVDPTVVSASLRYSWVDPELARDSCFLIERRVGSQWVDTQLVSDVEQGGGPPRSFGLTDQCPQVGRVYQSDFGFEFYDDPLPEGRWRLRYVRTAHDEREVRASAEFEVP